MLFRTEEERLCQKYTALMEKAFKTALFDKEKSDKINARAKKNYGSAEKNEL
ncbi:Lacal_2735 family protein [Gillisia marina]|uniref:Lacal_2735 family protein n=1 Tax=Gillisia marina TaxID=1167637 RepID=UPI0002F27FB0|nr:Lacal_2735 family protein [Gillisia marina]